MYQIKNGQLRNVCTTDKILADFMNNTKPSIWNRLLKFLGII